MTDLTVDDVLITVGITAVGCAFVVYALGWILHVKRADDDAPSRDRPFKTY